MRKKSDKRTVMVKILFNVSCFCIAVLIYCGCNTAQQKNMADAYTFTPKNPLLVFLANNTADQPQERSILDSVIPLVIETRVTVKQALDTLGASLSRTYFRTYGYQETRIAFAVHSVITIPVSPRPMKIAVIDILDPDTVAFHTFFQGSTGAQTTYVILVATFCQPNFTPPLLDGVIFIYNGEQIPELDHIDLSGIQVPDAVERSVHLLLLQRELKEKG